MNRSIKGLLSNKFRKVSGVLRVGYGKIRGYGITGRAVGQISRTIQSFDVVANRVSRVSGELRSCVHLVYLFNARQRDGVVCQFVSTCLSLYLPDHGLVLFLLNISFFTLDLCSFDESLLDSTSEVMYIVYVLRFINTLPDDNLINCLLILSCVRVVVTSTSTFRHGHMCFSLELSIPLFYALLVFILNVFCCHLFSHFWL